MYSSGVSVVLWMWSNGLGSTPSLRAHSEDFRNYFETLEIYLSAHHGHLRPNNNFKDASGLMRTHVIETPPVH